MIAQETLELEQHALLLYPVGHSDLNLDGVRLPHDPDFRPDFRNVVRTLRREIAPGDSPVRDLVCRADGRLKEMSFPIVVPVIAGTSTIAARC